MFKCFFLCIYTLVFLFPFNVNAQQISASSFTYTLPVLRDQEINVIKRYDFISAENKDNQSIELDLKLDEWASSLIAEFTLYKSYGDTNLIKGNNQSNYEKITTFPASKGLNHLKVNLDIKKGINSVFLCVKLNSFKTLLQPFEIKYDRLILNGKKIKLKESNISRHRLAIAVRRHKQDGIHTSRIPGIITAKDGALVAVYDARYESSRDLQGHMDIAVSRSLDKGLTWLPYTVALDMKTYGGLAEKFNGVSDANVLIDDKNGDIYIAGLWMYGVIDETGVWYPGEKNGKEIWNHQWKTKGSQPGFGLKQTAQFLLVKSTDNGKTWSAPINLTKMCKVPEWWLWAPAPGHGITLRDGTLVIPTQGRNQKGEPFSNITFSKDGGKTWHTSSPALNESTTECMAVELEDGSIMLNMRSNLNVTQKGDKNGRAIAITKDLGKTWTEHPTSHQALIEPTCMGSIHKHHFFEKGKRKSILLFCNPDSKYARDHMTIKVSRNDGQTWTKKVLLDQAKSRGYSCITSIDENTIGILYESSQADLVFQQVSLSELL